MATRKKTTRKTAAKRVAASVKATPKTARLAARSAESVSAPAGGALVVVESPAKGRTISKYLGRGYTVLPTVGHLMDLPEKKLGIDIENSFEPEYVTIEGKEKTLGDLKASAKKSEIVYLATDPDREGEAIAWHVQTQLKTKG